MIGMSRTRSIRKTLTRNDSGETGAHMAGIHVPKKEEVLSFFPVLDKKALNPRCQMAFLDEEGRWWHFSFIYYNNKFFGGSRNEYRLTGMTAYFKKNNLKAGDTVFLVENQDGSRTISFSRRQNLRVSTDGVLKLNTTWQVVDRR